MDDLFSLTSLTPVSSRPSSPMPVDSVVSQEPTAPQGPQPPQEQSESEVSAPIVRHFRSPSRELSYFDPVPVPQRQVPATSHEDAPPTQHNTMEPQVETPQIVSRPQLPADPPTVPSDPDVNSLARKDSWSFTDRAMASMAADPPDFHPFSMARQIQTSPSRHFSFPPPSLPTPAPSSISRALPPPPPPPPSRPLEIPSTPESRRPLDVARSLRRRATQNGGGASTSGGHRSRFPGLLSAATALPRARVLSSPSKTIPTAIPTPPRRLATTPMPQAPSSTATGRGTGMMAPQGTTTPSATTPTSQPTGLAPQPAGLAPQPTGLAPQPTAATRPTATPQPTAAARPTATPQPTAAPHPPATPQPPALPQPTATSQSTTTTPPTTTSSVTPQLTTVLPMATPPPTSIPPSTPRPAATLNRESRTPSVSLSSSTPPAPAEPGPSQPFRVRTLDFNRR